jgi:hypothetical protein
MEILQNKAICGGRYVCLLHVITCWNDKEITTIKLAMGVIMD